MENSRTAILSLYHILCRFSSRAHPLSMEEIRALPQRTADVIARHLPADSGNR